MQSAQERIDEIQAMEQLKVMEKIQNIAKEAGLEVMIKPAGKKTRKRSKTAAQYRNPANPSETWTGRGRKPKWVQDAISSGKSLEQMAV